METTGIKQRLAAAWAALFGQQEEPFWEQEEQSPPVEPPKPKPRPRFFRGKMEVDGKMTLEEYQPALDFKDIPQWLLDGSFFRTEDRRNDNKALLLDIAGVAYLRATFGVEEARRLLYPEQDEEKED